MASMFPPAESGATDVTAARSAMAAAAAVAAAARGALAVFLALGAVLHHRRAPEAMRVGHRGLRRSCFRRVRGHRA